MARLLGSSRRRVGWVFLLSLIVALGLLSVAAATLLSHLGRLIG